MQDKYKVKEQVWASKGKRFLNFIIDRFVVTVTIFCLAYFVGLIFQLTENYELLDSMANINRFNSLCNLFCSIRK